ncbi:E3 ubiquitin-protein ligase WAV3-like [Triticum dicoccoides]|uniref:E3 ubiquitin-protein ligase WAV3-like n=1 Tax=Triticum dicoccoides TaxID=85692 RepID=UPI00188FE259|nr:E3 ubiquitin-protein ligase WAV3-like [Triticum dicoccoides]
MESRCPACFHPRSGTAATCPVCDAARTTTFGVSPAARTVHGSFSPAQPEHRPTANRFSFGGSPAQPEHLSTANPFSFGGSPAQPTSLPFRTDNVPETCVYDDDETVVEPLLDRQSVVQEALVLKTHCEIPAVARGTAHDGFAVLVHAKAPGVASTAEKTPVDLVTVLDVSGSMTGQKLELLKDAMGFVVDNLGPADRLSVVSFSDHARRVTPLARMSVAGKASAKLAVQSLYADGFTNILKGLKMAAKVLDGRQHKNTVASIILLSDGKDSYQQQRSYQYLVPRSLARRGGRPMAPIHTFGFGTDHDPAAMHAIAELTGGTYSFIENQAVVQDAFAQCIGGLLSVTAQEAWIAITCPHPDVRVRDVKSGRHESRVLAYGRAASVDIGELYADEERRFLLLVDVPRVAGVTDDDAMATPLIKASCTYKDTATGKSMEVAGEDAIVQRPAEVTTDQEPSIEVEVERFRVEATQDIAAARAAAERGDYAEAARILDRRQKAAAGNLAGDARCMALVYELGELSARVATRREYEQTGRSTLLSGMSSHEQQRASSASLFGSMAPAMTAGSAARGHFYSESSAIAFGAAAGAFATPAMKNMVDSSRKIREMRQQSPATINFAPNNGGS